MVEFLRKAFTEDVGKAWSGKLLLSFFFFLGAVAIYDILDDIEQVGGRIHVAIALVYELTGKVGVATLFGVLPGCFCAVLALRQWRHEAKTRTADSDR